MKDLVKYDIISRLLGVLSWGIISPYITVLKGLLTVELISSFMILTSLAIELMKVFTRKLNYKQVVKIRIIYDVIMVLVVVGTFALFSKEVFVIAWLAVVIPYALLLNMESTKFRAIVGWFYNIELSEKIGVLTTLVRNRSMLFATAIAGILSMSGLNNDYLIYLFVTIYLILIAQGIHGYKKYVITYKHLKV